MIEKIELENENINSDATVIERNVFGGKEKLKKIVEEVVDTELVKKEHKISVDDLKTEVQENFQLWESLEDDFLDVFPDIEGVDLVNCLDEIKKVNYLLGMHIDNSMLKIILLRIKEAQKNDKKEENNKKNPKKIAEELHDMFLHETVDYFDEAFDKFVEEKKSFFGHLVYLQSCQKELDEKQKKILDYWLEEMMAWIMEGHALEIYEINIVGGKLVIKGQISGKNMTIIYDITSKKFENINLADQKISDQLKLKIMDRINPDSDENVEE